VALNGTMFRQPIQKVLANYRYILHTPRDTKDIHIQTRHIHTSMLTQLVCHLVRHTKSGQIIKATRTLNGTRFVGRRSMLNYIS